MLELLKFFLLRILVPLSDMCCTIVVYYLLNQVASAVDLL